MRLRYGVTVVAVGACATQPPSFQATATANSEPAEASGVAAGNHVTPSLHGTNTSSAVVTSLAASSAANRAPAPSDSPVPELVVYATGERTLRGFLARPEGTGPFPVMIFNHGSEKLPGPKPTHVAFFTRHGFVTFIPHRRGQGRSEGTYIMDEVTGAPEGQGVALAKKLSEQVDDVEAAVAYVKKLPYVDSSRIAISGCSFGGIETLLAAEREMGIRAAVDFAGGAMSWRFPGNQPLRDSMKKAARRARVPVFFIQAENDFDTSPTRELSEEMAKAGLPHRDKIYPPNGTTPQEGHAFCKGGDAPGWGPDVLEFLASTMQTP